MENYSLDLRWVEYKRSHLNCPICSRFTVTRMHRITQGSRLMVHCVAVAKASGIGTISCCHGEEKVRRWRDWSGDFPASLCNSTLHLSSHALVIPGCVPNSQ